MDSSFGSVEVSRIAGTLLADGYFVFNEDSFLCPKTVSVNKEVSMALWNQPTPDSSSEKPVPPAPTAYVDRDSGRDHFNADSGADARRKAQPPIAASRCSVPA